MGTHTTAGELASRTHKPIYNPIPAVLAVSLFCDGQRHRDSTSHQEG